MSSADFWVSISVSVTEATLIILVSAVPSTIAALASLVTAMRVQRVHDLVNGQYSMQLRKTSDALNVVAEIKPTLENIEKAIVAQKITDDHLNVAAPIKS